MPKLLLLLLLIGGIAVGVYLVGQQQIFQSKASNDHPAVAAIQIEGQSLNPNDDTQLATVDLSQKNPVHMTIKYADGQADKNFVFKFESTVLHCDGNTCPAPSAAQARCDDGTLRINWDKVEGASKYALRVNNQTDGFDSCDTKPSGDGCPETTDTSYTLNNAPAGNYDAWIHAVGANGNFSSDARHISAIVACQQNSNCAYGLCKPGLTLSSNGGAIYATWTKVEGAAFYAIRLSTNNATPDTDQNDRYGDGNTTRYSHACQSGKSYYFWVHPMKGDGQYGEAIQQSVTCQGGSSTTAGTIMCNGSAKTLEEMKAGLRAAGWGGNYNDTNEVIATFVRTAKCREGVQPLSGGSSGSSGGSSNSCNWQDRSPECDWDHHRARAVQQNSCTGEYRYPFWQFQAGNCGFTPGNSEGNMCTYGESYSGGTRACLGTIQGGICKWNGGSPDQICDKW